MTCTLGDRRIQTAGEDRERMAHAAEVYRARGREYRALLEPI